MKTQEPDPRSTNLGKYSGMIGAVSGALSVIITAILVEMTCPYVYSTLNIDVIESVILLTAMGSALGYFIGKMVIA